MEKFRGRRGRPQPQHGRDARRRLANEPATAALADARRFPRAPPASLAPLQDARRPPSRPNWIPMPPASGGRSPAKAPSTPAAQPVGSIGARLAPMDGSEKTGQEEMRRGAENDAPRDRDETRTPHPPALAFALARAKPSLNGKAPPGATAHRSTPKAPCMRAKRKRPRFCGARNERLHYSFCPRSA